MTLDAIGQKYENFPSRFYANIIKGYEGFLHVTVKNAAAPLKLVLLFFSCFTFYPYIGIRFLLCLLISKNTRHQVAHEPYRDLAGFFNGDKELAEKMRVKARQANS